MSTISVSELKTHLSREIKQVIKGKSRVVTDHGHPVALLSPIKSASAHIVTEAKYPMSTFKRSVSISVKTDPLVFLLEERQR